MVNPPDPSILDPSAFVDFVCEVLSAEYETVQRFGENKDGGIDIVAELDGQRTIIQCKRLSGTTSDPTRAWNTESKRLTANLVIDDDRFVGEKQYLPWLSQSSPIRKYIFCHSRSSRNLQQAETLKSADVELAKKLTTFLRKEIAIREGFGHLATVDVEVCSGDSLLHKCKQRQNLLFRYFGPELPPGIVPVRQRRTLEASTELGFQGYLQGTKLRYLSRSAFVTNRNISGAPFLTEERLLDMLYSTSLEQPVLLVSTQTVARENPTAVLCIDFFPMQL